MFSVLICISFLLVVFHCTSLSLRVKLESDKMMWRTLKCVFPLGWKKLIGVCGASTCTFLMNFFPHFVDKELTFMQQLWSKCRTECTEISSSVTEAGDCITVHRRAAKLLRAGSTECFTQFDVAGGLKEIEGSYCSWKRTKAPARRKYQEGLGDIKKSQYPLQKLVP